MFSRQPAHRRRGVERLRDADERHRVPVEDVDELGEVSERARQPVDLVDDHHLDEALLDVGEQPLQPRPFQRGARDAAVIVLVAHQHPALRLLAGDLGLAGLALACRLLNSCSSPSSLLFLV